jgi:hypothetical protein
MKHEQPNRWKGFIIGTASSAAGIMAMNYYWQAAKALSGKDPRTEVAEDGPHQFDSISLVGNHHQKDESSTMAMGRVIYTVLSGKSPNSDETKNLLSNVVHWGYGMSQGGLYGAVRAGKPFPDITGGLAFGTGLWAFGDELAVSALGFADGPTKFPFSQHAHRWGAHLTYGLVTALLTRMLYCLF